MDINVKVLNEYQNLTEEMVLVVFKTLAASYHDGHFTIFSFSTGYKAVFGTANVPMDPEDENYQRLQRIPPFKTLKEAMLWAISEDFVF